MIKSTYPFWAEINQMSKAEQDELVRRYLDEVAAELCDAQFVDLCQRAIAKRDRLVSQRARRNYCA